MGVATWGDVGLTYALDRTGVLELEARAGAQAAGGRVPRGRRCVRHHGRHRPLRSAGGPAMLHGARCGRHCPGCPRNLTQMKLEMWQHYHAGVRKRSQPGQLSVPADEREAQQGMCRSFVHICVLG